MRPWTLAGDLLVAVMALVGVGAGVCWPAAAGVLGAGVLIGAACGVARVISLSIRHRHKERHV